MRRAVTSILPTRFCKQTATRVVGGRVLAVVLVLSAASVTQAQTAPASASVVRLTLQQDLSSKLPNGSAFSAVDGAGEVYTGYIATTKAKWFHGLWNRGTIRLVFDQPMQIVSIGGKTVNEKKNGEAPARTGARVMQAAELGVAYSVAKIVDDAYLDKPYGVGQSKAIPIDIAIAFGTVVVLPGPQAKLKAGTVIEAQPVEREALPAAATPEKK